MEGDKVGYFLLIFGHEDTLGLVFDMLEKLCLSNVMEYVLYCVYNVNIILISFTSLRSLVDCSNSFFYGLSSLLSLSSISSRIPTYLVRPSLLQLLNSHPNFIYFSWNSLSYLSPTLVV